MNLVSSNSPFQRRPSIPLGSSGPFVHMGPENDSNSATQKKIKQDKKEGVPRAARAAISFLAAAGSAARRPPRETEFVILVVLVTHGRTTLITTEQTSLSTK